MNRLFDIEDRGDNAATIYFDGVKVATIEAKPNGDGYMRELQFRVCGIEYAYHTNPTTGHHAHTSVWVGQNVTDYYSGPTSAGAGVVAWLKEAARF